MEFLRITATDGTRQWVPIENVLEVATAADVVGADTVYAAGRIQRGLITDLKYLSGAAAAEPTIVEVADIAVFNNSNPLYEIGRLTVDGAFSAIISNKAVNY